MRVPARRKTLARTSLNSLLNWYLTRRGNPDILVCSMMNCQEISAACASEDFEEALELWAGANAFLEDGRHVDFSVPEQPLDIESRKGIPAQRLTGARWTMTNVVEVALASFDISHPRRGVLTGHLVIGGLKPLFWTFYGS